MENEFFVNSAVYQRLGQGKRAGSVKLRCVGTNRRMNVSAKCLKHFQSTASFFKTRFITRTKLAVKVVSLGRRAFRASFQKLPNADEVANELLEGFDDLTTSFKRKRVRQVMYGQRRVMHCVLERSEDDDVMVELGRVRVLDLEVASEQGFAKAQRLLDLRTIEELIVSGVKYIVKS